MPRERQDPARDTAWLADMLAAARAVRDFCAGRTFEEYDADLFFRSAVERQVAEETGFSALVSPGLVLITEQATIDPARSTGRFAGATGTFTIERLADAATGVTGITAGTFEGTISLATPSQR